MTDPIYSGPIAPERNPPINPEYFIPDVFFITALTLGPTTTVTMASTIIDPVTVTNNFVIGQQVRLLLGEFYGARQLNQRVGYVIAIPSTNQVTVNIDSKVCDPFIPNPPFGPNRPQIVPIGDINTGNINAFGRILNKTYIPGSFRNISPLRG